MFGTLNFGVLEFGFGFKVLDLMFSLGFGVRSLGFDFVFWHGIWSSVFWVWYFVVWEFRYGILF